MTSRLWFEGAQGIFPATMWPDFSQDAGYYDTLKDTPPLSLTRASLPKRIRLPPYAPLHCRNEPAKRTRLMLAEKETRHP